MEAIDIYLDREARIRELEAERDVAKTAVGDLLEKCREFAGEMETCACLSAGFTGLANQRGCTCGQCERNKRREIFLLKLSANGTRILEVAETPQEGVTMEASDIYLDRSEWKGRAEVAEARILELEAFRSAYRIVEEQSIKRMQAAEGNFVLMDYELKVLKEWASQAAEALRPLAAPTDAHKATTADYVLTGYVAPLGDCRRASEVLAAMPKVKT